MIDHSRRRILHFNATFNPTAAWVIQQLREAFPFDAAPKYLVFDRDSIFSIKVVRFVKAMGIKPCRTAYRSPWQNAYAERWVKSVKDKCLSKLILFGEKSRRRVLFEYLIHFYTERNHQGKDNLLLFPSNLQSTLSSNRTVHCRERLGGLLKYYHREAA